jgi:hypothetical protein
MFINRDFWGRAGEHNDFFRKDEKGVKGKRVKVNIIYVKG